MGDVRAKIALESGKVTEGCWNCRQTIVLWHQCVLLLCSGSVSIAPRLSGSVHP